MLHEAAESELLVMSGRSHCTSAEAAIEEAARGWDEAPEVVFAFASTAQEPHATARALGERFPRSIVIGCTSSGEHLMSEHSRGSIVLSGLTRSGITWGTAVVRDLGDMDAAKAESAVAELFRSAGLVAEEVDPTELFCIGLFDGTSGREEIVTALVADALAGVRLIGGSAGDDLKFERTYVFSGGEAITDGVVLLLGRATRGPDGKLPFEIMKHQHFTAGGAMLAVTKVDQGGRCVREIDGRPAVVAYANALGIAVSELTTDLAFLHPVSFSCEGEMYVRSVQRFGEDGSIHFYCAIEEGMVLELGGHHDMVESLERDLSLVLSGEPAAFLLRFNCVLRALESESRGQTGALDRLWMRSATAGIGFDTYGEQLDGLHINQTVLALALRSPSSSSERESGGTS